MNESVKMTELPFKVVVFAGQALAIATINMLMQQQRLGGIVLSPQVDAFSQQLEAWLGQSGISCIRLAPNNPEMVANQLLRWETNLVISFGFPHVLSESVLNSSTFGVYHLHPAPLPAYSGPTPLYWQIRDGQRNTQLTLQKAMLDNDDGDIALVQSLAIDPLDTLQCLENKVAQQVPAVVDQLINHLRENEGQIELTIQQGEVTTAPTPQEADLYVDWSTRGAEQICALARAGNSQLGGCIVVINQTPISLMQATAVKHPTYGVKAGTICHTGEPEGVIVATCDGGAIRLDILTNADGVFSGLNFIERFSIHAGMDFVSTPAAKEKQ